MCRDYVVLMRVTLVLCIDVMRGSILLFLFACCIYTGSFGLKLCDINFGGPTEINVCLQLVSLRLSRTMQDEAAGGEGLQQGRVANIQSIFRRPDKFKLGDNFDLFWKKTILYFEAIDLQYGKKKRLALLFNLNSGGSSNGASGAKPHQ